MSEQYLTGQAKIPILKGMPAKAAEYDKLTDCSTV